MWRPTRTHTYAHTERSERKERREEWGERGGKMGGGERDERERGRELA